MKELFRLWITQKRRDFSWRTFFVGAFLTIYFVFIVLALYFGLREELDKIPMSFAMAALAPMMAVAVVPADLLMKVFWRRSPVEMDDYLRTRPISHRDWGHFILMDTALGGLQWMLPLMMTFVSALIMPWWAVMLTFLLTYSCVMVNALFQNCWRRAPGNQWTLPLVFGYMVWLVLSYVVAIACLMVAGIGNEEADTTSSNLVVGTLVGSLALLLLNVVVGSVLQWYFTRLRNHNEEMHAPVAVTARSLGEVSVWSIEWVQLLRSKRLRVSFITIAVVFLLNTYMQQNPDIQKDFGGVNLMLLFGIAFPSIILAQWVLGVEANFFSGIWTKPWSVVGILRRKYYFFCGVCALMALFILPCVFWMGMSFWSWLAALIFGCGVFVLPFMATCLFSSRMDLFASAFFNYQGGNKQINVFSFIMFIPMAIYFASYFLLPKPWSHVVVGGIGLLGLALHRSYIGWVSRRWFNRRYEIMERWLKE